jgi:anti-sigma factor RsiW
MTSANDSQRCAEVEALLAERASGPLDEASAAALDAHLASCGACQAASQQWETLFSFVALPAPKLKEEAALRGLSERTLAAWQHEEQRRRRRPAVLVSAGGLLAAAAALLLFWHSPESPGGRASVPTGAVSDGAPVAQLDWTDGPTWEMDEGESSDASADDATLLDGLAFEGDGAFSLGDSG